MAVLNHLEPEAVFRFFEQLCAIPHGSGNTKAVSDWCVDFGRARGLEVHQDAACNVILIQAATPGYETAAPVILQGHLDMVCEAAPECTKDLAVEGLDLAVDGDAVYARGTTLGGDDGIAVAMALAILDDAALPHPRLEVVLTTEEEIGMLGAAALDVSPLRGRRLLNLDSEDEGVFTVGCAGGSRVTCTLPLTREPFDGTALCVTVGGLAGGHSGQMIHLGRGNANLLLGRTLRAMAARTALRLVWAEGGAKDNAIPVAASAWVVAADASAALVAAAETETAVRRELGAADPGVFIRGTEAVREETPLDAPSTARALCLLTCAPNGVQTMSRDIPGLVQTSLSLGILTTAADALTAVFCVRSSLDSEKAALHERLLCLTEQLGGRVAVTGDYPAWEYRPDSPLRKQMAEVYREQTGREPKMEVIHAGVECGLLAAKLPGLDCVSVGPDLREIHTPRERMSIASVQRVWTFVLEVLRRSR